MRAFLLLPVVACVLYGDEGSAEKLRSNAQKLIAEHKLSGALTIYRDLTRIDPQTVDHWIWKARLEAWTSAYRDADATYDEIERRWPLNVEALVGRVYLESWREHFGKAEEYLDRARTLSPDDVGVLAVRVRFFRLQGKRAQARGALALIEAKYPQHAEVAAIRREVDEMEARLRVSMGSTLDQIIPNQVGRTDLFRVDYSANRNSLGIVLTSTHRGIESPVGAGVNYTRRLGNNYWVSANAGFSAGALATSSSAYGAGASRKLFRRQSAGVAYSHVQFRSASVNSLSPSLETAVSANATVTLSVGNVWIRKQPNLTQSARNMTIRYQGLFLNKRLNLTMGVSASTALVNSVTESQLGIGGDKTLFGGATYRLNSKSFLGVELNRRFQGQNPRWLGIGCYLGHSW